MIHFLHIGKTGGSAIKFALQPVAEAFGIVLHSHRTRTDSIGDDPFFFCVRDPIGRFVSGFNSRLRQGQPRYDVPWYEDEKEVFAVFRSPNQLAEALSAAGELREIAERGMGAVRHLRDPQHTWITTPRAPLWVGFQESLDADFRDLRRLLGLPESVVLPDDPMIAHRTPAGFSTELSERARANLLAWYAKDYAFIEALRRQKSSPRH